MAGCPSADSPAPAEAPAPSSDPAPTVWRPEVRGEIAGLRVDVLHVHEASPEDGSVVVSVRAQAHQTIARRAQGLESAGGDVLVRPGRVALETEAGRYEAEVPSEDFAGWSAPQASPYQAVWTLRFKVPFEDARERLTLSMRVFGQRLVLPLRGDPAGDQGEEGTWWTPLGDDGRPFGGALEAEQPGRSVVWDPREGPLWLPAGSGRWTLQAEGYPPTPWTVPDDAGPVGAISLAPSSPAAAARSHLARALEVGGWGRRVAGRAWVDRPSSSPEALAAWVRAEVGVLPAQGLVRSADALVRTGLGTPVERALFLHGLLEDRGLRARVQCADPSPAQAAAIYPDPSWEPLDGEAALAEGLIAAPRPEGQRPAGRREAVGLVPEWCWVAYADEEGAPWQRLPLTPEAAAVDLSDLEDHTWRVFNRAPGEGWRLRVRVVAYTDHPSEGRAERVLLTRDLTPDLLETVGLVVDLVPEGAGYRVRDGVVHPEEIGMREGGWFRRDALSTLQVEVFVRDPMGMVPDRWEWTLWEHDPAIEPPARWRMVVAGDLRDDAEGRLLAERVDALRPGRHAAPGALALALESWRLLAERGDAFAAHEPGVMLSWVEVGSEGSARRFVQPLRPPSVATLAQGETLARQQAALSARDAVARARALGVDAPGPPVRAIEDGAALGSVAGVGRRVQTSLVRALPQGALGVSDGGDLWWRDPVSGAWMWVAPAGVAAPWAPADTSRQDLIVGEAAWDRPIRCLVQRGWPGVDPAPACRADPDRPASDTDQADAVGEAASPSPGASIR